MTLKLPRGVHGQSVRKPGLDAILLRKIADNDDYSVTSFQWATLCVRGCVYLYTNTLHMHRYNRGHHIHMRRTCESFFFPKVF